MPSTPLPFDTEAFFERTAHYASAGRGQFTLLRVPHIFNPNALDPSNTGIINRLNARLVTLDVDKLGVASEILTEGWAAKSITIPQMGLMTHPAFTYSGPTKSMAYLQNFGNLDVEFLMMGKTPQEAQSLLYFFSRWQESIAGPRKQLTGGAIVEPDGEISTSDSIPFDVEYYDNYTTEAEISIFSPNVGNTTGSAPSIISARLTELYPLTINPITVNWDNGDTILSIIVSFHFYYIKILG